MSNIASPVTIVEKLGQKVMADTIDLTQQRCVFGFRGVWTSNISKYSNSKHTLIHWIHTSRSCINSWFMLLSSSRLKHNWRIPKRNTTFYMVSSLGIDPKQRDRWCSLQRGFRILLHVLFSLVPNQLWCTLQTFPLSYNYSTRTEKNTSDLTARPQGNISLYHRVRISARRRASTNICASVKIT